MYRDSFTYEKIMLTDSFLLVNSFILLERERERERDPSGVLSEFRAGKLVIIHQLCKKSVNKFLYFPCKTFWGKICFLQEAFLCIVVNIKQIIVIQSYGFLLRSCGNCMIFLNS
jgi:hypothetical protein